VSATKWLNIRLLYLDNTAPTIVLGSTSDLRTSRPTIRWTASEDVKFLCSLDDGQFFDCGNGTTGLWTGRSLDDGPHKFIIKGRDTTLNTGMLTYTWNKGKYMSSWGVMKKCPIANLIFKIFWGSLDNTST
jgi:hypothetical protein